MIEKEVRFYFTEEPVRVIVTVPPNLIDEGVQAVLRPMPSLEEMKDDGDFTPKRLLVNFEIIENGRSLKEFGQLIGLQVYFTHKDLESESAGKPLALAFWDGNIKKWVPFKKAKNNWTVKKVLIDDPPWAGYFEIEFDEWSDPPMALGN